MENIHMKRTIGFSSASMRQFVRLRLCFALFSIGSLLVDAQPVDTRLLGAILKGDNDAAKSDSANDSKLDVRDSNGRTPVMAAVLTGDAKLVNSLLDKGADLSLKDNNGVSARQLAVLLSDFSMMEIIDRKLGDAKKWDSIPANERERFFKDLESDSSEKRQEVLLDAVKAQDQGLVAALLKRKTNPNTFGKYGVRTPLMLASENGNLSIVRNLLENEADPNIVTKAGDYDDRLGGSAIFYAARKGHVEIVRVLLQRGANANLKTGGGETPLMAAAACPKGEGVVKLLLDEAAKVDAKRADGMTALAIASTEGGSDETVKLLLDAKAEVALTTAKGDLLALATDAQRTKVVKLMLSHNPPKEAKDLAMLVAAYNGNIEIVKLLLAAGVDANVQHPRPKSRPAKTAIQYAADKGHSEVVALLKKAGAKDEPQVKFSAGETVSIDPSKVTKAEWRKAVAPFDVTSAQYKLVSLSEANFKSRFGKPTKEQRLGDSLYWYFGCSDGTLQVVVDADFLPQQGVMIQSINEY